MYGMMCSLYFVYLCYLNSNVATFPLVSFVRMKPVGHDRTVLAISLCLNGSKTGTAYIGDYVQTLTSMKEGWMPFPVVTTSLDLIAGKCLD
jgi:hypothetical protein